MLVHPSQSCIMPEVFNQTAYRVTVAGTLWPRLVEFAVMDSFGPKILALAISVTAFDASGSIWVVDQPRKP